MVASGSEQLAEISATCFLYAISHLLTTKLPSTVIEDVDKRYWRAFPRCVDLRGLPRPIATTMVHYLFGDDCGEPSIGWRCYNPSTDELLLFTRGLAQAVRFGRHRRRPWLVGFALRFLSQDPLPPTTVVIDCLTIIAANLDCDVSNDSVALGERCVNSS